MRILGINLQVPQDPSCAEAFLKISPRVRFRYPCFVFIDIEPEPTGDPLHLSHLAHFSSSHFSAFNSFDGGETKILEKALKIAKVFETSEASKVTVAIADTAPHAQMLTEFKPSIITKQGFDYEIMNTLPIQSLRSLEGLEAWQHTSEVDHVISFFQMLGIHRVQEVMHFKLASFRERWGDFGAKLWNRLHQKEIQIIPTLETREPLCANAYFNKPINTINHLLSELTPALESLFLRLDGLDRLAQKLHLMLSCEYFEIKRFVSIEPVAANRDFEVFRDLLLRKIDDLNLENPIRQIEIEIEDIPEKSQQLDFLEPHGQTENQWQRLVNFANQSIADSGSYLNQPLR